MSDTVASPDHKKRKVEPVDAANPDPATAVPAPGSHLLVKRLSERAQLPTRGSALAAGYDLYR
jgi:dUTP pyrophosphatase